MKIISYQDLCLTYFLLEFYRFSIYLIKLNILVVVMVVYNFIKQDRVVVETYWNLLSLKNENCFKKVLFYLQWKISMENCLKTFSPFLFLKKKKLSKGLKKAFADFIQYSLHLRAWPMFQSLICLINVRTAVCNKFGKKNKFRENPFH